MQVVTWLETLGLRDHAAAFRQNHVRLSSPAALLPQRSVASTQFSSSCPAHFSRPAHNARAGRRRLPPGPQHGQPPRRCAILHLPGNMSEDVVICLLNRQRCWRHCCQCCRRSRGGRTTACTHKQSTRGVGLWCTRAPVREAWWQCPGQVVFCMYIDA